MSGMGRVKIALIVMAVAAVVLAPVAYGYLTTRHTLDELVEQSIRRGGELLDSDDRLQKRRIPVLDGRGSEIGVSVRNAEQADAARATLPAPAGAVVEEVRAQSPAEKAGLRSGDLIVEFDGERVRSARQFTRVVQETPSGRTVKTSVMRDGQKIEVEVTPDSASSGIWIDGDRIARSIEEGLGHLGRRLPSPPDFNFGFEFPDTAFGRGRLGVSVGELGPQLAQYFGAKEGVLIESVTEGSPAAKGGLKAGDVITSVAERPIASRRDLVRALRDIDDGREVTIGIIRDKKAMTLKATLEDRAPRQLRPSRPA